MAIFNLPINTFAAGEFSPRAQSRTDIQQYTQGAAEIKNFLVTPHGLEKRMGSLYQTFTGTAAADTTYLATLLGSAFTTQFRTLPYESSFGTRALLLISTCAASGAARFAGYCAANSSHVLTSYTVSSVFLTYSATYRAITLAQLDAMTWVQVGDLLFIQIPGHPTLIFYDNGTTFVFAQLEDVTLPNTPISTTSLAFERFVFLPVNVLNCQGRGTLTPSATAAGDVTMLSSAGIFKATHVGARFKLSSGTNTYRSYVKTVTNSTTATFTLLDAIDLVTPFGDSTTRSWEEQAWSDAQGWPTAIGYYQQRLIRADATGVIRGSLQGNLNYHMERKFEQDTTFSSAITNDRPFSFQVSDSDGKIPAAKWISGGKGLILGTQETEYSISSKNGSIGPVNIPEVSPDSAFGSEAVKSVRLGNAIYYIPRGGQRIHEMAFDFNEDSYKSNDILLLSDHLPKARAVGSYVSTQIKIIRLAVDKTRQQLWAVSKDGGLFSCGINRQIPMAGWSQHLFGGTDSLSDGYPYVTDVWTLKNADGNVDVWVSMVRTINSLQVASIELISPRWDEPDVGGGSTVLSMFLDMATTYASGTYSTFTGLSYLNGQTVAVVYDGIYLGNYVVSGGVVTLAASLSVGSYAVVGLKFTAKVKTLDLEAGSPIGSAQGLYKKASRAVVRLYRTIGLRVGMNDSTVRDPVPFRTQTMGAAMIDVFTGDKTLELPLGIDRKCQVVIESPDPFPCTINGVFLQGKTNV